MKQRVESAVSGVLGFFDILRTSPYRLGAFYATWRLTNNERFHNALPPRNTLPEPIDIRDHIGNVHTTVMFAIAPAWIAGCIAGAVTGGQNTRAVRIAALTTGLVFGIAANVVGETETGQAIAGHVMDRPLTEANESVVDFLYGVGGAAVSSYVVRSGEPLRPWPIFRTQAKLQPPPGGAERG